MNIWWLSTRLTIKGSGELYPSSIKPLERFSCIALRAMFLNLGRFSPIVFPNPVTFEYHRYTAYLSICLCTMAFRWTIDHCNIQGFFSSPLPGTGFCPPGNDFLPLCLVPDPEDSQPSLPWGWWVSSLSDPGAWHQEIMRCFVWLEDIPQWHEKPTSLPKTLSSIFSAEENEKFTFIFFWSLDVSFGGRQGNYRSGIVQSEWGRQPTFVLGTGS